MLYFALEVERRSCRSYLDNQITDEELGKILKAGLAAPSAMNRQSAVFVVVQDKKTIAKLSKLNAEVMNSDKDPFYGAPTVIVVLADRNNANAVQDGSLAMGNLMNAAHALGIGSCWINRAYEVFEKEEGKALLSERAFSLIAMSARSRSLSWISPRGCQRFHRKQRIQCTLLWNMESLFQSGRSGKDSRKMVKVSDEIHRVLHPWNRYSKAVCYSLRRKNESRTCLLFRNR